jgi:hypothetical protein
MGDGHREETAVGRLPRGGIDEVMDVPPIGPPAGDPHRRGGDGADVDPRDGDRPAPARRILDADQPRTALRRGTAGNDVAARLEQERRVPADALDPVGGPAQREPLADPAQVDRVGEPEPVGRPCDRAP